MTETYRGLIARIKPEQRHSSTGKFFKKTYQINLIKVAEKVVYKWNM